MTGWLPCNIGMLQFVNGIPYYVTVSTVGNASTGFIVVKKYVAGAWSAGVSSAFQTTDISVCVSGTTIYILHENVLGNDPLILSRYSTLTDTFLTDAAGGPINSAGSDYLSINVFPDGKMLTTNVDGTNNVVAAVYDPGLDTWAGPVTVKAAPPLGFIKFVFGVCIQNSTSLAFIFYANVSAGGGVVNVFCKSCTEALALGAEQAFLNLTTSAGNESIDANLAIGKPSIIGDGTGSPYLILPYLDPGSAGPPSPSYVNLHVARATPATNPVFAFESVLTTVAPVYFQTFDLLNDNIVFDSAVQDQGGTAYLFFVTDNGDLDSATSQAKLQYVSSTAPGTWSAPTVLYTTPVPNELTSPFLARDQAGNIAIAINQWNPVLYTGGGDQIAALASFLFLQGAAPIAPTFLASSILNALGCASIVFPFVLSCCRQCDMDPPMQRGKVVYASGSEFEY
jgi:hypothetical protein